MSPKPATSLTADLAQELYDAERQQRMLTPFSGRHAELDPGDAYAIQEAYADLRRAAGARLVGRKIGCTSQAIQELFGIDEPDYGHIFADMVVPDAGGIVRAELIQPMAEPEIAFRLAADLTGPDLDVQQVLAATQQVAPCLEIIDSRFIDWQVRFVDTVADNGSSARCIFGPPVDFDGCDLAAVVGRMTHNGNLIGEAAGTAVLGHPAAAVAWLGNALAGFGTRLRAGDWVLSGSLMTAVRVEAGDRVEALFSELGSVSVVFV